MKPVENLVRIFLKKDKTYFEGFMKKFSYNDKFVKEWVELDFFKDLNNFTNVDVNKDK